MAKTIKAEDLGAVIGEELTIYHKDVIDALNKAGSKAIKNIERKTKDTAPFNAQAYHKHYVDYIATKAEENRTGGKKFLWYVKPPAHRLTHLLVRGHETRNGGRTRGDPFLANAVAEVMPEYERDVEEALKNGK